MKIEYRPATDDDLELMMAWLSHPELYERYHSLEGPIKWEGNLDWWNSREGRRDWIITVKTDEKWRDVGNVNLKHLNTELPEVGIYIGEITLWGEGIATEAVNFAIDWLRERNYSKAKARILDNNKGSKRVFKKVGFQCVGDAREKESEYHIEF